ncbi:MAG: hypothetical protein E6767_20790 [Dysgonomonas sp.]|nr:hypothetical protein [Dysgonomonas sp.]
MRKHYLLLAILSILLFSCKEQKEQSGFFFKIPEMDLGITTSKKIGAEFYVMFSSDSIGLSNNVDYLKYKTGDMSEVNLIFDPKNKKNIYIRETEYLKEINSVNYSLQVLENSKFDSLFFNPRIKTNPLILKYPFIKVGISTSTYGIYIKKHEVNFKRIKEGDILGGW